MQWSNCFLLAVFTTSPVGPDYFEIGMVDGVLCDTNEIVYFFA